MELRRCGIAARLTAVIACAFLAGLLPALPAAAQYGSWTYSRNIDVLSGSLARTDAPVVAPVNFTSWLPAGKTLDLNSIRVVEYTSAARTTIVGEKPSQFDQGSGFDATSNAAGELVWLLDGSTPASATRYYKVYFDTTDAPKTAPNYTPGVTWNAGTRTVSASAYNAVLSSKYGGITKLENKLSGSPKTMWNAPDNGYPRFGSWHTINEDGQGWIDSFNGAATADYTVVAGPVRVTIISRRSSGTTFWTITRKFYAGSPAVPYFEVATQADKNAGAPGSGTVWLKRTVWTTDGAPVARTIVPPDNFGGVVTHDVVYDYGSDGGVGVASSHNFAPDSSEDYDVNGMVRQAQFDTWGESWKLSGYPVKMDYAFVLHNDTSESAALTDMTAAWNQYNNPVIPVVGGSSTVWGVVTDADTSSPVRDAVIRIAYGSGPTAIYTTAKSSATGAYVLAGVTPASVTLSARADHYQYQSQNIDTSPAGVMQHDIQLSRAPFVNLKSTTQGGSVDWILGMDQLSGGPVVPPSDDFSATGASEAGFVPTEVPLDWDVQQGTANDLYGWYRVPVTVPLNMAGSDLLLRDYRVDDVDAAYFNGTKVGQTGAFPPANDPRNGSLAAIAPAAARKYWIANNLVQFGGQNLIAMRVFDYQQAGGVTPGSPVLEQAPPSVTVSGTVSGPGGPISGATVEIEGIGSATTSGGGGYSIVHVLGDSYQVRASAFGYKPKTLTVEFPDAGNVALNITLESAGTISGTVTRGGAPMANCRVYITGPSTVTGLTDANGQYALSALFGNYTVVFNGYGAAPKTQAITVDGAETLNADLTYGVTPVYDAFPGSSLDMGKWQFANLEPIGSPGNAVPTVANGILKLEDTPGRGGIMSTASFGPIATHEVMIPRPYVGINQLMDLYGGSGGFGNFVEMANEGYFLGVAPVVRAFGTAQQLATASWAGYPFSMAVVRTYDYYDFYVDNHYWHSDVSNGLTSQDSRVYLYGFEPDGGETISFFSSLAAGTPVAPAARSIGDSRDDSAGSAVSVSGAVVTATFGDSFFIEQADRASGIRVLAFPGLPFENPPRPNPAVGDTVTVVGRTAHINKEAILQNIDFTITGQTTVPDPVTVSNTSAAVMDTPGATPQGMLVTVFGKVTGVTRDDQFNVSGIFIDDGAGLPGNGTYAGLYLPVPSAWADLGFVGPFGGEYLTATGVLTVDTSSGSPIPALRARTPDDVAWF